MAKTEATGEDREVRMKIKNKGLGRIPKSLSWIGSVEEEMTTTETIHTPQPEVQRESSSVKTSDFAKARSDKTAAWAIAESDGSTDREAEVKLAPAVHHTR